jgi:hypothetical protein
MTNILNRKNIYDQVWYVKTNFLDESGMWRSQDSYQEQLLQRNIYMLPFVPSLGVSYNF